MCDRLTIDKTIAANLETRLQEVNVMMRKLEEMNNKTVDAYLCLLSECVNQQAKEDITEKRKAKNKRQTEIKKKTINIQQLKNRI